MGDQITCTKKRLRCFIRLRHSRIWRANPKGCAVKGFLRAIPALWALTECAGSASSTRTRASIRTISMTWVPCPGDCLLRLGPSRA